MNYYAGIDVSLEESCICVIDANGKVDQQAPTRSIEFQKLLLQEFALRSAWRASPGLHWLAMHRPERRSPHPDQAAQGLRVQKSWADWHGITSISLILLIYLKQIRLDKTAVFSRCIVPLHRRRDQGERLYEPGVVDVVSASDFRSNDRSSALSASSATSRRRKSSLCCTLPLCTAALYAA
jgi:hypothetical protein